MAVPPGASGEALNVITRAQLCGEVAVLPSDPSFEYVSVMRTMCGGTTPAEFMKRVGAVAKKRTCDVTWTRGSWLYHCKQCQADPACALCVECFDESKHKVTTRERERVLYLPWVTKRRDMTTHSHELEGDVAIVATQMHGMQRLFVIDTLSQRQATQMRCWRQRMRLSRRPLLRL